MARHTAAQQIPTADAIGTRPTFTRAQGKAERIERARRHAANCILLAVVTSPEIAAELIDSALDHTRIVRDASNGEVLQLEPAMTARR